MLFTDKFVQTFLFCEETVFPEIVRNAVQVGFSVRGESFKHFFLEVCHPASVKQCVIVDHGVPEQVALDIKVKSFKLFHQIYLDGRVFYAAEPVSAAAFNLFFWRLSVQRFPSGKSLSAQHLISEVVDPVYKSGYGRAADKSLAVDY